MQSALRPESHSCLICRPTALYILCDLWWEGGLCASGQGEDPGTAKHHAGVDRCAAVYWTCQGSQVLTLTCKKEKRKEKRQKTKQNSNVKSSISSIMFLSLLWILVGIVGDYNIWTRSHNLSYACSLWWFLLQCTANVRDIRPYRWSALPKLFMQTVITVYGQLIMCMKISSLLINPSFINYKVFHQSCPAHALCNSLTRFCTQQVIYPIAAI